jgi:hypothetical protein
MRTRKHVTCKAVFPFQFVLENYCLCMGTDSTQYALQQPTHERLVQETLIMEEKMYLFHISNKLQPIKLQTVKLKKFIYY